MYIIYVCDSLWENHPIIRVTIAWMGFCDTDVYEECNEIWAMGIPLLVVKHPNVFVQLCISESDNAYRIRNNTNFFAETLKFFSIVILNIVYTFAGSLGTQRGMFSHRLSHIFITSTYVYVSDSYNLWQQDYIAIIMTNCLSGSLTFNYRMNSVGN